MNFGSGPPILLPTLEQLWALALMAVGIALLARAARLIWKDLRLRRAGRTAKGQVVRVIGGHESDKLVVGFTDFQGRAHQFETDLSQTSGTFPVGLRSASAMIPTARSGHTSPTSRSAAPSSACCCLSAASR